MQKHRRNRQTDTIDDSSFYDTNNTVSNSEMTGLVPSGITDVSEAENYGELYSVHTPTAPNNKKK